MGDALAAVSGVTMLGLQWLQFPGTACARVAHRRAARQRGSAAARQRERSCDGQLMRYGGRPIDELATASHPPRFLLSVPDISGLRGFLSIFHQYHHYRCQPQLSESVVGSQVNSRRAANSPSPRTRRSASSALDCDRQIRRKRPAGLACAAEPLKATAPPVVSHVWAQET